MPRIPDASDLGPIAGNFNSGRPIAPGPRDYIGPALQGLGGSVAGVGQEWAQQAQKEQSFDAAARYQQFQNAQQDLLRQAKEKMPLGGGNATAAFRSQYQQAANKANYVF